MSNLPSNPPTYVPVRDSKGRMDWRAEMVREKLWEYSLKYVPVPAVREMVEEIEALRAQVDKSAPETPASSDTDRLDLIGSEYLTVVPFDMPTGQGDADVGWRVFQSHQGAGDVMVAEEYSDDLRRVLDAAGAALAPTTEGNKS